MNIMFDICKIEAQATKIIGEKSLSFFRIVKSDDTVHNNEVSRDIPRICL